MPDTSTRVSSINLDDLTADELLQLKDRIDVAIKKRIKEDKEEARRKIQEILVQYDLDISDVLPKAMANKGKRRQIPAKYAHPTDASLTWSGRGRRPAWFDEALEAGTKEEDLLIEAE